MQAPAIATKVRDHDDGFERIGSEGFDRLGFRAWRILCFGGTFCRGDRSALGEDCAGDDNQPE